MEANHSSGNTTVIGVSKDFYLTTPEVLLLALYTVIFIIGVAGNILVARFFGASNLKKKAGSRLVIALAINDLLASVLVPINQIHSIISRNLNPVAAWYLGKPLCYTMIGISFTFLLATGWLLVAISIERFM